jgi:hypothetical protein
MKAIVTTTIYAKNETLEKYDNIKDWTLIVVGDQKTPKDFSLKNGIYLNPSEQEKLAKNLSDLIGWNCIQRRSLAFVMAKKLGADIIATIDDDNIPLDNWGNNLAIGKEIDVTEYVVDTLAFDPIGITNYPHLWHRGFPLELLRKRKLLSQNKIRGNFDIQACFWNGDPDIDAICRMEHAPECDFDPIFFPFCSNKMGPFNSQNTFISKEVLPHYFMFPSIGRMDDIWASYYVQALGFRAFYDLPTVYQARNPQNLIKNMEAEYLGYSNNMSLLERLQKEGFQSLKHFLPERALLAFREYQKFFPELLEEHRI